jgi:tetratricopeptide (TPR) repeat protein
MRIHYILSLLLGACAVVCSSACRPDKTVQNRVVLQDAPLTDAQVALLDIAFAAASAMPLHPHIKNRSRAQEVVVQTCLELKQPLRAQGYIGQIANWRRGLGYADLALFCARNGFPDDAISYLEQAKQVLTEAEDWRRDRIRVRMAQVYTWLGRIQEAEGLVEGVEEAETGKVESARALLCHEDTFDALTATLDAALATGSLDPVKNALLAYARLFERFYTDPVRRDQVEQKIVEFWGPVPLFVRIELLADLAEVALAQDDSPKALELVDQVTALMEGAEWDLEHGLPRWAHLLSLRFQAGDEQRARTEADAALARYDRQRETVVTIYRAETLRPLAECYQVMGDTARARSLYDRVLQEGIANPNSRPRAEDLAATCCSMALLGMEPDAPMWQRIREIRNSLGDPW